MRRAIAQFAPLLLALGCGESSPAAPPADASAPPDAPPGGTDAGSEPCPGATPVLCDGTSLTLTEGSRRIDGPCRTGPVTISGSGCLSVALPSPGDAWRVEGDLVVQGSAHVVLRGGRLTVANTRPEEYAIKVHEQARLEWYDTALETHDPLGAGDFALYMHLDVADDARVLLRGASLDPLKAWLLADLHDRAALVEEDVRYVPTEQYLDDAVSVTIRGAATHTGLWLAYHGGSTELTLPNTSGPFTWAVDTAHGSAAPFSLQVVDAQPGLGINAWPGSSITVHGRGIRNELKIGYFASGAETLTGLKPGLQTATVVGGRVRLDHVDLGPIAWQLYAVGPSQLVVEDSVVNEVGVAGPGSVTLRRCLLQLALLAAVAPEARVRVEQSRIWSQSIRAAADKAQISISESDVYGSSFEAVAPTASIAVVGGAFHDNPSGCTPDRMIDPTTGVPSCNPFHAAGPPTRSGRGQVTCTGTVMCAW